LTTKKETTSPLLAFLTLGVVQFPCTHQYRRKSRSLNNDLPHRSWQVLLLGGPSGVGKTSVSYRLAHHFGTGITEVDDFQVILERMTTPTEQPVLHYWRTHAEAGNQPAEEIVKRTIAVGQVMVPALEAVIANHIESRAVPGQSCWPQNPPFDVNLALLVAGNTCLLRKSTTHKTSQSAGRFVIWLSANKRHFLFRHLVMIGVTTDTFCVDFWRFLLRSRTIPAKQRVHQLSSSFQDGFAGQERDHLPDQISHTLLQRAGKRREASHHSVRHAVHGP